MIRRPPRSTRKESSAASDVYKRQVYEFLFPMVGEVGRSGEFTQADVSIQVGAFFNREDPVPLGRAEFKAKPPPPVMPARKDAGEMITIDDDEALPAPPKAPPPKAMPAPGSRDEGKRPRIQPATKHGALPVAPRIQNTKEKPPKPPDDQTAKPAEKSIVRKMQCGRQCICLLYTSPSPRDQRGSRMPSSA